MNSVLMDQRSEKYSGKKRKKTMKQISIFIESAWVLLLDSSLKTSLFISKESVIKQEKTVQHKPTVDSFVVAPQKQHEKRDFMFSSQETWF